MNRDLAEMQDAEVSVGGPLWKSAVVPSTIDCCTGDGAVAVDE